jgi:hypothetical protein
VQEHHLHIPFLAFASLLSYLLPVIVGLIQFKSSSGEMRAILGMFSVYIPISLISFYLMHRGINTVWLGQIFELIEYVVLASVFASWSRNKKVQGAIKLGIVGFLVAWIIAKLSFEKLTLYDTFTSPLAELLLSAMAINTLITLLGEEGKSLHRDVRFWVSIAVVVYCIGTLPLFAVANILLTRPLEEFARIWSINWGLTIVANILYAIAFFSAKVIITPEEIDAHF